MDEKVRRILDWSKGKARGPVRIELHPTDRCNLKCRFCWQVTVKDPNSLPQLPESKLLSIVDEAAELDVREWIISGGGEPLVRKSTTLEILKRIKQHGMWGQLTTNGTLFRERDVIKLIKIGWDQVQISVDGPNARIQNYLRQARGAFQKAVRTARLFTLWKKRLKSDKPYLGFNTVLTRLVFDKMDEMIRLAAEVGSQLVYVEPLYPGYLKGERLELNEDEKRKFKKCIGKVMKLAKELGVSTNIDHFLEIELVDKSSFEQTVLKQVEKLSPTLLHAPCYQPWYLMGIKGSGLTGCCSTFETGEWIQNKSLEEIWFGPFFDRIREKMIKRELPSYCSKCSVVVVMDNRKLRKQLLKSVAV